MTTSSRGTYVGIDVSRDRPDVAVQVDNTQKGIKELVAWMQELGPELMVVEATGGYQRAVVEGLFQAGLSVAVVNPTRVRQFARAKPSTNDLPKLARLGRENDRVLERRKENPG